MRNKSEKVVVPILAAVCAAFWGYCVPANLPVAPLWRLIALPAALLVGGLMVLRYRAVLSAPAALEMSGPEAASATERLIITCGAVVTGLVGGFIIPGVLTRHFPRLTVAVPLSLLLALLLGLYAWHNPEMFFKNRRF
jgi:hypothetical protein